MKNFLKYSLIFLIAISQVSCSYKPILDHNDKYMSVGEKQADADAEACKKEADAAIDKYKNERAGKEAVRKGVIGALFGTVFGFLVGGNLRSTLGGAAIGTGVGAAIGAGSVYGEDKVTPSEMKQTYVKNCLARQGYSVLGWR